MARPIRATISAPALRHNYAQAKAAAPRSRVLAVVKANGYGHGLDRVARSLGPVVDGFGTLEIEGAVRLRESGFAGEIVLLEGFFEASELAVIAGARLATSVHSEEQLRMLHASPPPTPIDIYLKINTGMNRLGIAPRAAKGALDRIRESGAAKSITLMTHFANADGPAGVAEAMRRFEEATQGLALPRSLANSAAIFAHPETHADTVREGVALYGATPFADRSAEQLGLKPVMTLTSQVIAVQELEPGDTVGYGSTFRCDRAMRIGVVACGYADGYPRHAPSGTPVVVGGVRTKTVGRVSMDMITVDLKPVSHARVGTPVTLWGEGLPIDEVAVASGTVGYELMCAVMPRVPIIEVA
ncbi:alanine racemase [Usitatibacter palustris]|uniref:Alanine racemase n=1 Tax=Usitatibacter palustris TaxID=2732487 RepID=A0A6M4H7R5_9PROT|nr:alanine racemase [Usitatibacter palustris]QJR15661.1 Alanine racemase, catabolic [Usitatibacter palustris]